MLIAHCPIEGIQISEDAASCTHDNIDTFFGDLPHGAGLLVLGRQSAAQSHYIEKIAMTKNASTSSMTHQGYLVISRTGPMFFGLEDLEEAMKYCQPKAMPVRLFADEAETAAHEHAQGEDDA
ncbi:hypothetical protein GCM10007320_66240 [Pseudorhodoferax aquiterrae]|uniref:Uncharacterized protein n=1 Tax=Pseudorhodoferax aquiterrae TaxID=747304 RepID=A0ABQ3GG35_9BURK|nr:hypothetical protein [Pseudorhodoferax aquiterrae]GHD04878.1 hypothetical protein GCM10007320_66240 [Pseudorhodoferax aquiterrae]